jgi:8-oxo-dGTP pyrophosphatase MutT (NUDIX family)
MDTTGRVLIQHREREDRYLLPGGSIESGETWQAALAREAAEECQVTLGTATVTYLGHQVVAGDPDHIGPALRCLQ